jgi:rhodanese-related sulfurtransferase
LQWYERDAVIARLAAMAASETEIGLSAERVAEMLREDGVELVDVREPHEWEAGHIGGARHIPLDRLPSEAETIARDRPLVFQCRGGNRSAMAAAAFRQAGYNAYNMEGGLKAWADRGLPLEPEDGRVAEP